MVPLELEKVGCTTQKDTSDLPMEGEITCILSAGKVKSTRTALTELPPVFKYTPTSNVPPTTKTPCAGLRYKEAFSAYAKNGKKARETAKPQSLKTLIAFILQYR